MWRNDLAMRGSKGEKKIFLFLPAICSSVSWSACGWKTKREGGRGLQTKMLLNKALIPSPKLFRHYIPRRPHTPTTTQLNSDHSVQGSVSYDLLSALARFTNDNTLTCLLAPVSYQPMHWGWGCPSVRGTFATLDVFYISYLNGKSFSKQSYTMLDWLCPCNTLALTDSILTRSLLLWLP